MHRKILLTSLLIGSTLSAACTEEQMAKMVKLNLSSEVIEKNCKDIPKEESSQNEEPKQVQSTKRTTHGEDKNLYIGFGVSSGSGTQTREYSSTYYNQGGTYETEYDASGKTIKLGYIFESKNRFEFSISSFDAKRTDGQAFNMNTNDIQNSKFTGYDFDWLFTFRNKEALQPYLGLGFGVYKNNDIDGYNLQTGNADTATGLALNFMGGATYHFNDTFELEAGYKGKHIGWNLEDPEMDESIGGLYFGANIKF